jgi:hypothetical protein
MPRLSVVIPTLSRPDTLRHALATLAAQNGDHCEFIVQNNGGDPATAALVEGLDDRRFRHFATARVVTMTENWEAALGHTTGDYVLFIGDDDGLMPDACAVATTILDGPAPPALLSWSPFAYYWPGYYHEGYRNRLVAAVDFRFTAERVVSRDELARFYRFQTHYARLPMIYNSFVRRDVIQQMQGVAGRYFLGLSPDVTSGIVNAALTGEFLRLSRPLSISGLSQHSTGHRTFFEASDALASDDGRRDFGAIARDPRLPDLNALPLFLANDMLLVKQRLFPDFAAITLDFRALAQAVATDINDRPELYDRSRQAILKLAEQHGFDPFTITVPARQARRPPLATGVGVIGPNRVQFTLDGAALGVASIADAVRVLAELAPRAESLDLTARPPGGADLHGVGFGRFGAGLTALAEGWSEPEEWGTWSVAKTSSLLLRFQPRPTAPFVLALTCRSFVAERHPHLLVRCRIGDAAPLEWHFTPSAPGGCRLLQIDPSSLAADGTVRIGFEMIEPRAPADVGVSPDTRPLGIGIERMWVAG